MFVGPGVVTTNDDTMRPPRRATTPLRGADPAARLPRRRRRGAHARRRGRRGGLRGGRRGGHARRAAASGRDGRAGAYGSRGARRGADRAMAALRRRQRQLPVHHGGSTPTAPPWRSACWRWRRSAHSRRPRSDACGGAGRRRCRPRPTTSSAPRARPRATRWRSRSRASASAPSATDAVQPAGVVRGHGAVRALDHRRDPLAGRVRPVPQRARRPAPRPPLRPRDRRDDDRGQRLVVRRRTRPRTRGSPSRSGSGSA